MSENSPDNRSRQSPEDRFEIIEIDAIEVSEWVIRVTLTGRLERFTNEDIIIEWQITGGPDELEVWQGSWLVGEYHSADGELLQSTSYVWELGSDVDDTDAVVAELIEQAKTYVSLVSEDVGSDERSPQLMEMYGALPVFMCLTGLTLNAYAVWFASISDEPMSPLTEMVVMGMLFGILMGLFPWLKTYRRAVGYRFGTALYDNHRTD
jgi:hypothetical protein